MPEPKTSSKRKVEHVEAMCKEEKDTPRLWPKGGKSNEKKKVAAAKSRSSHRRRRKPKTYESKSESKWDLDDDSYGDDSKWASSDSSWGSDGEKRGWSSDENKECKGKDHSYRSPRRPPKSPGESTHMGSPWAHVRSVHMVPDRPAGLTWRNRFALAKAREEKERYEHTDRYTSNGPF